MLPVGNSMSSSTLRYLKLETIVYTSIYNVFALSCTNGESSLIILIVYQTGYCIDVIVLMYIC